jgi:hypothetical protein
MLFAAGKEQLKEEERRSKEGTLEEGLLEDVTSEGRRDSDGKNSQRTNPSDQSTIIGSEEFLCGQNQHGSRMNESRLNDSRNYAIENGQTFPQAEQNGNYDAQNEATDELSNSTTRVENFNEEIGGSGHSSGQRKSAQLRGTDLRNSAVMEMTEMKQ